MNVSFVWKDFQKTIHACQPCVDVVRTRHSFICHACISGGSIQTIVPRVDNELRGKNFDKCIMLLLLSDEKEFIINKVSICNNKKVKLPLDIP